MASEPGASAAAAYAARYDAVQAQVARLSAARPPADRWAPMAGRYTLDPHRPLTPEQEAVAADLGPDDVLLDIGGAAGRHGLPLALRCHEVVNVEPSPAMRAAFLAGAAADARGSRLADAARSPACWTWTSKMTRPPAPRWRRTSRSCSSRRRRASGRRSSSGRSGCSSLGRHALIALAHPVTPRHRATCRCFAAGRTVGAMTSAS